MRSIRSSSRGRTDGERGYALVWAIGLALLFFMLMQLVLIDSARELAEARRFRARIVAMTLAENGAELAAARIVDRDSGPVSAESSLGRIGGRMSRMTMQDPETGQTKTIFQIFADGETKGTDRVKATVEVHGTIENGALHIERTLHEP